MRNTSSSSLAFDLDCGHLDQSYIMFNYLLNLALLMRNNDYIKIEIGTKVFTHIICNFENEIIKIVAKIKLTR